MRSPVPSTVLRILLLGAFIFATNRNMGQAGELDPGFDPLGGADNTVRAMATRADGSVILGGQFTSFNGSPSGYIIQLQPTGEVDPGFATGTGFNGAIKDMVLQPDGNLIVAGLFTTYDGVATGGGLVRLLPSGSIDPVFAHPFFALAIESVALHVDGRIVLGGNMGTFSQTRVVQLLPNGAEDPSFNTFLQLNQGVFHVAVFQDGRIMVVGGFTAYGATPRAGLCVLNVDGSLETTFDPGTGTWGGADEAVVVTPDNKIILGGSFTSYNGTSALRSIRLNDDGSVDGTYSTGSGFTGGAVYDIALMPDGMLLVAGGFTTFNGTPRSRVCRLLASGALDTSFDPGSGPGGTVRCLAADPFDRVVLGGEFTSVAGTPRVRVVRLNACTATTWYADSDEDGFGDPLAVVSACSAPTGYVEDSTDCDDNDENVGGPVLWFFDGDEDEFGDPSNSLAACSQPSGYVADSTDCDDNDENVGGPVLWFFDGDEDEFGDPSNSLAACSQPSGYVVDSTDCDDNDEDIGGPMLWYFDGDEDEFGDPFNSMMACSQPAGYVEEGLDCDDNDPDVVLGGDCDDGDPYTVNDVQRGYPDCDCVGQTVVVSAKALLQGPYDAQNGLMKDDLRAGGLIPLVEPYTGLLYEVAPGSLAGGDAVDPSVLMVTGPDAIVDWAVLELRAGNDGAVPASTRYVLVQRDGDIVEPDGVSPVRFAVPYGYYRLAVLHRNHMGVVEGGGPFNNGNYFELTAVDFTDPGLVVHADPGARLMNNGVMLLRNGDTSFNDDLRYVGGNNDRDPILQLIGGSVPTNIMAGYHIEDVNLDGVVRYVGTNNDRDPILLGIGGSISTNVLLNVYLRPTY